MDEIKPEEKQREQIEGPEQPEMESIENKVDGGDYKFNLGLYRLDSLNNLMNMATKRYHKAFLKTEPKYVEKYQAIVNTLFVETYIYMKNETKIQDYGVDLEKKDVLEQILDEKPQNKTGEELEEHLQQLREIYLAVRQLLKEVGLDIPREETVGDTEIFEK